jgi:protease-4
MFVNMLLLGALSARTAVGKVSPARVFKDRQFEEVVLRHGDSREKIAVIPLNGIIAYQQPGSVGNSMVEDMIFAFDQAASDPAVKAIVLSVDSPGGEITASDVLYHQLKILSEKKPVVVFMNSIGTSGAYYIACGASHIMCNPTTFTGSIGVIISTLNYRELFGKIGLESVVFKSGKFKDMLNGARELSPEESAYVQGLVMQSYDRFLEVVATSRELPPPVLRAGPADGRILSGVDALRDGLVDAVGYMEEAWNKAAELAGVESPAVVRYEPRFAFGNFFRLFGESKSRELQLRVPALDATHQLEPGRIYLLPPFFAP